MARTDIRLALPSKGILQEGAMEFLAACGLKIFRPNPRQYEAKIPAIPGLTVMFQRPGDIVTGVRQGSLDFGITGLDVLMEKGNGTRINADEGGFSTAMTSISTEPQPQNPVLTLHDALGFGPCTLNLAIPENSPVQTMQELAEWAQELGENGRSLRIATKFPHLTGRFLDQHQVQPYKFIPVEGTLEIAPAIGYADLISDLVSSGITLRDNHLRPLADGLILRSQACLIANRNALKTRPEVLTVARQLLEYIEAHLRAESSYMVTANVRSDSAEALAERMFSQTSLGGLQGPTISRVIARPELQGQNWYAINIVVRKDQLFPAIAELRAIGGSGVIVSPLTYIFEEEPERYKAMLLALENS